MGFISQSLQDKITKATHKSDGSNSQEQEQEQEQEQQFTIQPHPAKTNDPADLQTNSADAQGSLFMPGPVITSQEQGANIPPPSSHDELQARSAELNKQ
ncbi:hypothetical protein SCHPADRAFT_939078 [Schizopora paradoxa]|uniref:Uncharacterized protein n=1 Tax=Schizopora paradoxa TaxID=27342 RepID=A0A0H2RT04_9AGAM|nr:hypothetical protein SCHPADRAFT_939078 [Schizopora paradoxa]